MLEMVNLLGMNTAEYVRRCITLDLCETCNDVDVPLEIEQMKARNETRFATSRPRRKATEPEQNMDSVVIVSD